VWQIYLAKEDFEKAKDACGNDQEKLEKISMRQADYYFGLKQYVYLFIFISYTTHYIIYTYYMFSIFTVVCVCVRF